MKTKYKLIIFDLDGTLVDTEGLYVRSLENACAERDFVLDHETATNFIYGKAWNSTFKDLNILRPGLFENSEDLQNDCSIYFNRMIESEDLAIKESVSLLRELAADKALCIVSGSSRGHIAHFIDTLEIKEEVKFYLGNEDYQAGKPEPECFLKAAMQGGAEAHECLVFEDSFAGVSAAKRAGMSCVGLKRPGNPQDISHADITLSCLSQFSFQHLTTQDLIK